MDDPAAPRRLLSRMPVEDEARASLATEVFSAALGLVQPQLDAYTALREGGAAVQAAEEALGEAHRAEGEAQAALEAAGTAGDAGDGGGEAGGEEEGAQSEAEASAQRRAVLKIKRARALKVMQTLMTSEEEGAAAS